MQYKHRPIPQIIHRGNNQAVYCDRQDMFLARAELFFVCGCHSGLRDYYLKRVIYRYASTKAGLSG